MFCKRSVLVIICLIFLTSCQNQEVAKINKSDLNPVSDFSVERHQKENAEALELSQQSLANCPVHVVEHWKEIEIKSLGIGFQVPDYWHDEGYVKMMDRNMDPREHFNMLGMANIYYGGGGEGVLLRVWRANGRNLEAFLKELVNWLPKKDFLDNFYLEGLFVQPVINASINDMEAHISFLPGYRTDVKNAIDHANSVTAFLRMGDYIFNFQFRLRENFDTTQVLTTMLESINLDGSADGKTVLPNHLLYLWRVNSCFSIPVE